MAWTTPRTWVPGELVTASMMNTHLRDNLNALRSEHFGTSSFRGVQLRTDPSSPTSKVVLEKFDEIVMSDGTRIANWTAPLYADITVSGAGGLDTASEAASNWYEILAIAKDDGTKNLLLRLAAAYYGDAANVSVNSSAHLRNTSANTKIGQSFQPGSSNLLSSFVDLSLTRVGSPSGSVTLELTDASRVVLATSYPVNVNVIPTASYQLIRFVFPVPPTVTAATTYHLQLSGTFTIDGTNYISTQINTADVYASGQRFTFDGSTWTSATTDMYFTTYLQRPWVAPTLPTGYTKYCRIGFVYNNGSSNFVPFRALDREVRFGAQTIIAGGSSTFPALVSLYSVVPPLPCLLHASYFGTVASDYFKAGGVPDGYDLTFGTLGNSLSVQLGTTGTSDVQHVMQPFLIDRQGMYYMRLSGTGTISIYGYGYSW